MSTYSLVKVRRKLQVWQHDMSAGRISETRLRLQTGFGTHLGEAPGLDSSLEQVRAGRPSQQGEEQAVLQSWISWWPAWCGPCWQLEGWPLPRPLSLSHRHQCHHHLRCQWHPPLLCVTHRHHLHLTVTALPCGPLEGSPRPLSRCQKTLQGAGGVFHGRLSSPAGHDKGECQRGALPSQQALGCHASTTDEHWLSYWMPLRRALGYRALNGRPSYLGGHWGLAHSFLTVVAPRHG